MQTGLIKFYCMFSSFAKIRAWFGMEWKMEWNRNFGVEHGTCQNGME